MNRWNDTFERRHPQPADGWAERARRYLRSRTADHWLMFIAGLLLGALLALQDLTPTRHVETT